MRKTISITDQRITNKIVPELNFSEIVEVALLYYYGYVSKEYIDTHKVMQDAIKEMKHSRNKC